MIFSLCERPRNSSLFLSRLGNWTITKENHNTNDGFMINWIPNPVYITIGKQSKRTKSESKVIMKSPLNVPENSLSSLKVILSGVAHVLQAC